MKHMYPYLHFNGTCAEAMNFYKEVFDGKLEIMPFTLMPNCDSVDKDRVLHSCLTAGPFLLQASDQPSAHPPALAPGSDVCIDCSSLAEEEQYYNALVEGGKATMPLQDTFWGARFGMLEDRFGVRWMFNFQHPHPVA